MGQCVHPTPKPAPCRSPRPLDTTRHVPTWLTPAAVCMYCVWPDGGVCQDGSRPLDHRPALRREVRGRLKQRPVERRALGLLLPGILTRGRLGGSCREFFMLLDQKQFSLAAANEEIERLCRTFFGNIFLFG